VHSTRTASDKVYQLLAHGRWFSPGTPASSTTKTGRHDIAEILLKLALKHKKSIKLSILKVTFLKSNPFRFKETLISFNSKLRWRREKGDASRHCVMGNVDQRYF
jgi:hypothetical protein